MVSATRHGERYCTVVTNGRVHLYSDTSKNGVGDARVPGGEDAR
ncbi:hypothetical protein BH160DRAFT_2977 [Burkholderia sp. H160]|nr:hypothetical protein BH160DRAFT_2977 [Burkholderia sp. H160]